MNELLKPFVDDRILCENCKQFGTRKWGGRCNAGEIYYVSQLHRCNQFKDKSVVFTQQANKKTWTEGDTPFWI